MRRRHCVGAAGQRRRTSHAADRDRVVAQPGPQAVRRAGGEGAGRADVLRLPLAVADVDARPGRAGRSRWRAASAGRRPGPPRRTARRTGAGQQLAVHHGGQHQRRRPSCRRRPAPASASSRAATTGSVTGRPSSASGTTSRAASTCSLASTCRGARGQSSASPASAPATRSAPWSTGSVTVPARTASRSYGVPLQRGAGHRGPQADLGRDLAAVPAQRAVPQRLVDPLAGAARRRARRRRASSSGASGSVVTPPR